MVPHRCGHASDATPVTPGCRIASGITTPLIETAPAEIIPALTRKVRHLPQQTEGQSSLQMQPIEAGHIGLKRSCSAQGLDSMGPQRNQFVAAQRFQPLGQHRQAIETVPSTQDRCAPGHHCCQNDRVRFSGLGDPHQCFGQRFDSAQLHSPFGAAMVSTGHKEGD